MLWNGHKGGSSKSYGTVMKAVPEGVLERLEQNKKLKKSCSSTAAREVSSRNGFTMPLVQDLFVPDRVALRPCNKSTTIKHSRTDLVCSSSFIHSHSSLIIMLKSCDDGRVVKQQV